jgi:hypothetical protein
MTAKKQRTAENCQSTRNGRLELFILLRNQVIMKNKMLIVILFAAIPGCSRDENGSHNLKLVETIPGGCAVSDTKSLESESVKQDTVTYSISNDELQIMVGFNATCCGSYNTTSELENNTISLNIEASQIGMCNCICYYTYNFRFRGVFNHRGAMNSINYKVNIDNYLFFNGLIRP